MKPCPPTQWPAYMTQRWGVPAELAKSSLGTMRAIENGEFDITSPRLRSDHRAQAQDDAAVPPSRCRDSARWLRAASLLQRPLYDKPHRSGAHLGWAIPVRGKRGGEDEKDRGRERTPDIDASPAIIAGQTALERGTMAVTPPPTTWW